MDSGNSGSMSSSGDEEYDSRSDMVPPFLNNPHPPPQFASFPFLSPPPPHHHQQPLHHAPPPPIFDIPPNYLQSLSSSSSSQTLHHLITSNNNPTPFLHLDTPTDDDQHPPSQPIINCIAPASSSKNQSLLNTNTDPSLQLRSLHDDPPSNAVRNPKKRSRASRRAPTTVLTTDTSNFRAMVQEFTGIPSPPFSSATSYSRRLDLLRSSPSTAAAAQPPFFPLRPPFVLSSASPSSTLMMLHNNNHVAVPPSSTSTSLNYQTETSYNNLPQNTLTMQILPFQTTPTTTLHSFNNNNNDPSLHVGFSGKSHQQNSSSIEDHLGMAHHPHLMNVVPPHVPTSEADGGDGIGGSANKDQVRPLFHVGAPCKLNFPAGASSSAAAAFNGDKSLESNSAARGEGNIESWICSSD